MAGDLTPAECPGSMGAARRAKRRQAQAAVEGKLAAAYEASGLVVCASASYSRVPVYMERISLSPTYFQCINF